MKLTEQRRLSILPLAVASIALVQMSHGGVTPALAVIGSSFEDTSPITQALLNTLPTIAGVPATLIAGRLAGKRVPFKDLLLFGLLLMFLGGLAAFFGTSMLMILICRAIFGIGLGIAVPLISSFTLCTFTDREAQKQLALNAVMANAGSILFQLLGGYLCLLGWQYTFLCYLIVLIPGCVCLWALRREDGRQKAATAVNTAGESAPSLSLWTALRWCLVYFAYFTSFYAFVNNMSSIIVYNGYGLSSSVAWVLSVFNLGGVLGSYLYRNYLRKLGRFVFLPALALSALGFGLVFFADGLVLLYAAGLLHGLGFGMFTPAFLFHCGTSVHTGNRPKMISYVTIANNVGGFTSAYIFLFLKDLFNVQGDRSMFSFSIAIFALLALYFLLWALQGRRQEFSAVQQS